MGQNEPRRSEIGRGESERGRWPAVTLSHRAARGCVSTGLISPEETHGLVSPGERESGGLPNVAIRLPADLFMPRAERRAGGIWHELTLCCG